MWYITYNAQTIGPMTAEQLPAYGLTPTSMVQKAGSNQWLPAYRFPELMQLMQSRGMAEATRLTDKDHVVAGVLALILGGFGVHYFYMGKTTAGFLAILLTLVTCSVWELVVLVQAIMMLCMSQAEFEQKYVLTSATFPLF
jgi:TM2 domain-containing membrane protein YozV